MADLISINQVLNWCELSVCLFDQNFLKEFQQDGCLTSTFSRHFPPTSVVVLLAFLHV